MSTIEYSCGHQASAHSGQAMPMQCACGEGEIVGARGKFYMSDEMSRSIRDAAMSAKPLQSPEWNGSDPIMPPVGTECEAEDVDHGWIRVRVIAHDDSEGVAVCKTVYGYDGYSKLRPARTQAQRDRDDLLTSIIEDYRKSLNSPVSTIEINLISEFSNYLFEIGMLRRAGE